VFDGHREFESFPYPEDTPIDDWLACAGKSRPRPIVLSTDVIPTKNITARKALRESGCTYALFDDRWSEMPWATEFCWKLLKSWPAVIQILAESDRQTVIHVPRNGKPSRVNLW
jgi:hypothetical protein